MSSIKGIYDIRLVVGCSSDNKNLYFFFVDYFFNGKSESGIKIVSYHELRRKTLLAIYAVKGFSENCTGIRIEPINFKRNPVCKESFGDLCDHVRAVIDNLDDDKYPTYHPYLINQ